MLDGSLPLVIHHQDAVRDAPFFDVVQALGPHLSRVESISVQGQFSLFETLRGTSFPSLCDVLMTAPELQHIGLHAMVAQLDGDPFPTLSTFLSRPSAPRGLEKLTLAVSVDETETLLQCLERMEELTHLSIHSTAFDGLAHESVFSRLTCREGESPLLPRLTAFQTALPPPDVRSSEAETALEEMITSRSTPRVCAFPGVAALVSVEINSNGMEDQPDESDACGESEGENEEEGE